MDTNIHEELYVRQAFATLSHRRQLLWYGAWAGFFAGLWFIAIVSLVLVALVGAAMSIEDGEFGTLYGQTPLVGTIFEPLWPIIVLLPTTLFFALVGAVSAIVLRAENIVRHALDHYFDPVRPHADLFAFWLLTFVLVFWGFQVLGITGPQTDLSGLIVLTGAIGGLIAWPLHGIWQRRYLLLIRQYGSASIDDILSRIRQQVGP